MTATDVERLMQQFEKFDPDTKAALAAQLQMKVESDPYIWYCKRGRACDGKPHDGVPYNHARPDQWPPAVRFFVWLIISGRGSGKTRTGSEFVRVRSKKSPRIAVVARRLADVRMTLVEGESGLIRICERAKVDYQWEPSKKVFTFDNGAKAFFYSAEEPDSLRGPEHSDAWLDEPAHMPLIEDVWSNLLLGLRLGNDPRVLATSTPLPTKWLKDLMGREDTETVRVSTYANLDNLAPTFRKTVIEKYEGTRLGRQELHGEILEDVEGALWDSEMLEMAHELPQVVYDFIREGKNLLDFAFERIIVSVDPAGTTNKKSDETGIIVVAAFQGMFYVLEDATGRYSPDQWAKKVVELYKKWSASRVVAEKNFGGDMVERNMRNQDENLPIKMVTSRKGKAIRAEPIVGLYEQSRVKHPVPLGGLESEQLQWVPGVGDSPNRVDALVHGITELSGKPSTTSIASARSIKAPATGGRIPGPGVRPSGLILPPSSGRIYRP